MPLIFSFFSYLPPSLNLQICSWGTGQNHSSDPWNIPFIFLASNSHVTGSEKTVTFPYLCWVPWAHRNLMQLQEGQIIQGITLLVWKVWVIWAKRGMLSSVKSPGCLSINPASSHSPMTTLPNFSRVPPPASRQISLELAILFLLPQNFSTSWHESGGFF